METLAERLRFSRDKANLTQDEVAQMFGIARRTVQNHERGENRPTAKLVKEYAQIYRVDWRWLLTGKGSPANGVEETHGLYGITSNTVIDGKTMKVTSYAPEDKQEPEIDSDVLLRRAFQVSMEKDIEISKLRSEIEALKNRLRKKR